MVSHICSECLTKKMFLRWPTLECQHKDENWHKLLEKHLKKEAELKTQEDLEEKIQQEMILHANALLEQEESFKQWFVKFPHLMLQGQTCETIVCDIKDGREESIKCVNEIRKARQRRQSAIFFLRSIAASLPVPAKLTLVGHAEHEWRDEQKQLWMWRPKDAGCFHPTDVEIVTIAPCGCVMRATCSPHHADTHVKLFVPWTFAGTSDIAPCTDHQNQNPPEIPIPENVLSRVRKLHAQLLEQKRKNPGNASSAY